MTKKQIADKNLELHGEFMKYAFNHPGILDRIPPGATVIILPKDDPILYKENLKTIKAEQKRGIPVVVVRMESPKPVMPEIEVLSA